MKTSDEISALVAEKVAGWTNIHVDEIQDVDIEERTIYISELLRGELNGKRVPVPPYATSADAVLPLLEQFNWTCWHDKDDYDIQLSSKDGSDITPFEPVVNGSGPTFPLAACIAILRSKGVEV